MRFLPEKYGNESIKRYSAILNQQFDADKPSWLQTLVQANELQDETEYLQLGFETQTDFFTHNKENIYASAWVEHPTRNSTGLYKFVSVEVNLSQQKLVIMRETYDVLSWLGDIGGLTDCLLIIAKFIIKPFTNFGL